MPSPAQALDLEHKQLARRRIVLVGQPNVGKSVLFHLLTGQYVAVSNYPGTTVDVSHGIGTIGGEPFSIIDSPGVNSLIAQSEEERVTRTLLLSRPDVLIQVADAKHLARTLTLTLELAELRLPMVLCLNMHDEALTRGFQVDIARLSKVLGIPVVETTATTREGFRELRQAVAKARVPEWKPIYVSEVQSAIRKLEPLLAAEHRVYCSLLMQNHTNPEELASCRITLPPQFKSEMEGLQSEFTRPLARVLAESRIEQAKILTAEVLSRQQPQQSLSQWLERFGRWAVRPWPGYLIAMAVLWLLYEFVGVFGAKTGVDFVENTVFGHWINPWVMLLVQKTIPWTPLRDILVGPYGVFTMALTYAFALLLPIVTTFFLAMSILEDSGYLPRLSVLLDRFFKLMGLNGKAVFPMILGLGCGTMAMLSARILDSKKERVLVSFLLALAVPCSAQLAVVLAMTAGLSIWVLVIWLAVMVGTLLGVGWVSSKVLPGAPSPFFLEIPPMRVPQMGNIFRKVYTRLKWYLKEVVPLFVLGTLILYAADALGWLTALERLGAPLVTGVLGLPAKATDAFVIGFLRRDYGAAGLYQLQRQGLLSLRQTTVSLVAITLFMPCIAQGMMALRERGLRTTLIMGGLVVSYAVAVAAIVNQALLAWGWV